MQLPFFRAPVGTPIGTHSSICFYVGSGNTRAPPPVADSETSLSVLFVDIRRECRCRKG